MIKEYYGYVDEVDENSCRFDALLCKDLKQSNIKPVILEVLKKPKGIRGDQWYKITVETKPSDYQSWQCPVVEIYEDITSDKHTKAVITMALEQVDDVTSGMLNILATMIAIQYNERN